MKTLKTLFRLSLLLALGAVLTAPADAAFESVKFDPENTLPRFPPALQANGIVRGDVIVAISVDAQGKIKDSLLLAYTSELLAKTTLDALKEWRFQPARLDGDPIPSQVELTVNYTLEGAVITSNIVNLYLFGRFEHAGDNRYVYRMRSPGELDRAPTPTNSPSPKYAEQAFKEGVRGKVQVHFYIDEQGAVRLPAVTNPDVSPYLAEKAVEAVREWKFEPPLSHGAPALVAASEEFSFGNGK